MSIAFIHRFITSLGFTMLVEGVIVFVVMRYVLKNRTVPTATLIFAGLFASFATIPYVWFVFRYGYKWNYQTSLYFSEPFVFATEALLYRYILNISWKNAFAISLIANVASYFSGPLLRGAGLWVYW